MFPRGLRPSREGGGGEGGQKPGTHRNTGPFTFNTRRITCYVATLVKHKFDIQGMSSVMIESIRMQLAGLAAKKASLQPTTVLFVEIPTNPDMKARARHACSSSREMVARRHVHATAGHTAGLTPCARCAAPLWVYHRLPPHAHARDAPLGT